MDVAQFAVERRHRGCREEIGRDDPGQSFEIAKLPADRRQRRRDDRLVHGAEEHRQHDTEDDRPDLWGESRAQFRLCVCFVGRGLDFGLLRSSFGFAEFRCPPTRSMPRQFLQSKTRQRGSAMCSNDMRRQAHGRQGLVLRSCRNYCSIVLVPSPRPVPEICLRLALFICAALMRASSRTYGTRRMTTSPAVPFPGYGAPMRAPARSGGSTRRGSGRPGTAKSRPESYDCYRPIRASRAMTA